MSQEIVPSPSGAVAAGKSRQLSPLPTDASTHRQMVRTMRETRWGYRTGNPPKIGDFLGNRGIHTAVVGSAIMSVPFLWPLSLGPVTSPCGALVMYVGWHLMIGRYDMVLPTKILNVRIPEAIHKLMVRLYMGLFPWLAWFARPGRMTSLTDGRFGEKWCGAWMVWGALMLAVPLPLMPLTNTLPALSIIIAIISWTMRDGLLSLIGVVVQVIGTVYIAIITYLFIFLGKEGVVWLFQYMGWDAVLAKVGLS